MRTCTVRLAVVVLAATLLGGCTRIAYIPPEQAGLFHHQTVESVEIAVAIVGTELKSGRTVTFAPPTALFSGQDRSLIGKDSLGNTVMVPLDSASLVFLCRADRPMSMSYSVPAISFLRETVGRRSPVCDGIFYPMKELVPLYGGGTYDTLSQTIDGKTKEGDSVSAPISSVARVAIEKFTFKSNDKGPAREQYVAPPKRNWTSGLAYLPLERAGLTHLQTLEAIEVPVAVTGIEMKSGKIISFAPPSGVYNRKEKSLTGVDSIGDSISVALDSVAFVGLRRLDRGASESNMIQADAFQVKYSSKSPVMMTGARYPFAERIKFDRNFGVFDTMYREVSGIDREKLPVTARFEVISGVGVRRFSAGKTIGTVVLYAGITIAIFAVAMNEVQKHMFDDWNWNWEYK